MLVDIKSVGSGCNTESGEGKGEVDMNSAGHKRKLNSAMSIEIAEHILNLLAKDRRDGQTFIKLDINRTNEDGGCEVRVPYSRNYSVVAIDEDDITFWEYLDVEASYETMDTSNGGNGRAVGFGPGVTMSLREFNGTMRTQNATTEAGGDTRIELKSGQRPNKEERWTRKDGAKLKREEKKMSSAAKESEDERIASSMYQNDIAECPHCKQQFLTEGWFKRHNRLNCMKKKDEKKSKLKGSRVRELVKVADEILVMEHTNRISELAHSNVDLNAPKGGSAKVGIKTIQDENGRIVVDEVSDLALKSARIYAGLIVEAINGEVPSPDDDLENRVLENGGSMSIKFRRQAKIPYHGFARKALHKKPRFTIHKRQLEWLEENVHKNGRWLLRPAEAAASMRAHFSNKLRADTRTPMWLEKDQIAAWVAERNKNEKRKRMFQRNEVQNGGSDVGGLSGHSSTNGGATGQSNKKGEKRKTEDGDQAPNKKAKEHESRKRKFESDDDIDDEDDFGAEDDEDE